MSAAYSRRQETIRQYREEPSTRAVTRQVSRPVTRPITRQVSRPVTRPVTRPITRQVSRPITRPVNRRNSSKNRQRNNSKPQLRVVQPVTRSKFSKVTLVIVTLASLFGFIVILRIIKQNN